MLTPSGQKVPFPTEKAARRFAANNRGQKIWNPEGKRVA